MTKLGLIAVLLVGASAYAQDVGWPHYGNDAGGTRYSASRQIDRTNVARLQLAWSYRTGGLERETALKRKAAFESTPILVENRLYLTTPYNHVIALDPRTGTRLWEYDPELNLSQNYSEVASRGVSAWVDSRAKEGQPCRLRVFMGTLDGRLIALDGETGKPCVDFGSEGEVSLTREVALHQSPDRLGQADSPRDVRRRNRQAAGQPYLRRVREAERGALRLVSHLHLLPERPAL
jgi:quinoprotein glucose dehydrogenase